MFSCKQNQRDPRIGEVYLMEFDGIGSEQTGWRPALVFQNNVGNQHSPNVIALPFTSAYKKVNQPTHVFVSSNDTDLLRDSIILCENPQRMSKKRIGNYITTLSNDYMKKVAVANLLATSAISFLDQDTLLDSWKRAVALNNSESYWLHTEVSEE